MNNAVYSAVTFGQGDDGVDPARVGGSGRMPHNSSRVPPAGGEQYANKRTRNKQSPDPEPLPLVRSTTRAHGYERHPSLTAESAYAKDNKLY